MNISSLLNDDRASSHPAGSANAAGGAREERPSNTRPMGHSRSLPAPESSSAGRHHRRLPTPSHTARCTSPLANYTTANTSALRSTTTSDLSAPSASSASTSNNSLLPLRQHHQRRSPPSTLSSSSSFTSAGPSTSSTSAPTSHHHHHLHPHHRPSAIASLRKNSSSSSSASSHRTMDSSYSTPFLSRSNSGDSAYHSPATPISPSSNDGLGFGSYGGSYDSGFQRPVLITHQSSSYGAPSYHSGEPYAMLQGFQFPAGNSPDSYPDPMGEPCSPTKKDSTSGQESPSSKPKRKTSYPCPHASEFHCNNVFTTSGHAARHAKVHTGEKNAVCPECKKAFTRKDNMEQHRKIHNGHKQASRSEDRARKSKIQQARKARRPSSISTVNSMSSHHDAGIDVSAGQAYYPHSASTDYSPMSFQHPHFSPPVSAVSPYLDGPYDNSHMHNDMGHFYSQMPMSPAGNMQVHSLDALALAAESSR